MSAEGSAFVTWECLLPNGNLIDRYSRFRP